MGLFNANRGHLGLDYDCGEIVANESYTHEFGFGQMLVDNAKNDMAIFEALIADDFREVMAVQEGTTYVNEASFGAFIDKLKEFFKKAWEKIKGIFQSFITKFVAMFIRDNKELVKKYEKQIRNKNLGKMKYKWAEPTDKFFKCIDDVCIIAKAEASDITKEIDKVDSEDLDKFNADEVIEGIFKEIGLNTTEADFYKDFDEFVFNEKDVEEGLSSTRLNSIIEELNSAKDTMKSIKEGQKACDRYFKDTLKMIDNLEKTLDSAKKNATGDEKSEAQKSLNGLYLFRNMATAGQKASNMVISATITAAKKYTAQCRRVFVQAASFNDKMVKEDAILFEAIGESAEFDILD